jgi:hypothetical protein
MTRKNIKQKALNIMSIHPKHITFGIGLGLTLAIITLIAVAPIVNELAYASDSIKQKNKAKSSASGFASLAAAKDVISLNNKAKAIASGFGTITAAHTQNNAICFVTATCV